MAPTIHKNRRAKMSHLQLMPHLWICHAGDIIDKLNLWRAINLVFPINQASRLMLDYYITLLKEIQKVLCNGSEDCPIQSQRWSQ